MHLSTTIILTGLAAHQVSASFGPGSWDKASQYTTPDNCDNNCSNEQKTGYDWAGLSTGSFNSYGSNKFNGWSCTNSFGKRDLLTKRNFQSKCISSNLDDSPSISCGGDDSMSIHKYQVSSSEDANIECHYEMPDQSVCTEYHSCSAGGTEIQNTQCGGAKSVTFKPAEGSQGKGCSIGIHSIKFNCGPASTQVPSYTSTSAPISSSTPIVYSTTSSEAPSSSCSEESESSCSSESSPVSQFTQSIPVYVPSSSSFSESSPVTQSTQSIPAYVSSTSSSSESSPVTESTQTIPAYGPSSSSCSESSPTTTAESSSSSLSSSSAQSAPESSSSENSPVTATTPSQSSTSDTNSIPAYTPATSAVITSTVPSYAGSSSVESSPSSSAAATVPASPQTYPPPATPELLPRCLNTWLYTVQCKDNCDYACFCKDSNFVNKVYGCLSAWSPSSSNTTNGVSYLMGLCAPYIAQNPAIVTGCPSTVTPAVYTPPAPTEVSPITQSSPAPTVPAALPCTTITYSSEVVQPATYSTGSSQGSPIPSSSCTTTIITTVTVPLVQITTHTVTESGSTVQVPNLGYGTPTSAPPQAESTVSAEAPLITDSSPSPVPPTVTGTSTVVVAPVGGSSGFATSAQATSAPSGIEPYQGAGSRTVAGGLVGVGIGLVGYLFVL